MTQLSTIDEEVGCLEDLSRPSDLHQPSIWTIDFVKFIV